MQRRTFLKNLAATATGLAAPSAIPQEEFRRTILPKKTLIREAMKQPTQATAEECRRLFYTFMQEFWCCVSDEIPRWNWHIEYLCGQLQRLAIRVAKGLPNEYDLIINVPPGTTKSITCSIMFPVWCWTRWPWMRFIVGSYSGALSLEHAEYSRELVRSDKFRALFPNLEIKQDKDTKSNFRIVEYLEDGTVKIGGNRYSTSVGGTVTGFHGHILIVDDPLNPKEAVSDVKLKTANDWMERTLSTRKVNKVVTPTVLIMQRLHQDDPSGHILAKPNKKVFHICLPAEIHTYKKFVRPVECINKYVDGLLDPVRMPLTVLQMAEMDLGQYGYAGQMGQNPVPPTGGMFQVDHFQIIDKAPEPVSTVATVRYWDKAGTADGGAFTAGCKMSRLVSNKLVIHDVKHGQWGTDERERIIRETAEADGTGVLVYHEQEPGSGGKDSALATITNLLGFTSFADRPTGNKIFRADPYSVQVNSGNVLLVRGEWNHNFIEEHRYFPFGKFKDQVDAASGACAKLALKKLVRRIV